MKSLKQFFARLLTMSSNLLVVILLLLSLAAWRGTIFGWNVADFFESDQVSSKEQLLREYSFLKDNWTEEASGVWKRSDSAGSEEKIIFSEVLASKVIGYGGPLALRIYLNNDKKISKVKLGRHYESAEFIEAILNKGLLKQFEGVASDKVADHQFDEITGATISSKAIIDTVKVSLNSLNLHAKNIESSAFKIQLMDLLNSYKFYLALVTVFSALIISFFLRKKSFMRPLQLILNFALLGVVCGQLVSMRFFINLFSSYFNLSMIIVLFILVLNFILGLFKRKNFYCNWLCPYGSAQELLGRIFKFKIKISAKAQKKLNHLRKILFGFLLLFSYFVGGGFIFNYEPFSVFLLQHASAGVIAVATIFLLLSAFIPRPWCRFVCPTGELLNFIQSENKQLKEK